MDCSLPGSSACQAPPSLEFSRQEYWSGLPFPSLGSLPNPEMEPTSLASPVLSGGFLTSSAPWEALFCLWTHGFSFCAMGYNLFLSLLWWSVVPTLTRGRGLRVARIVLIRYGGRYRYDNDHHERRPVSSSWIPRHGRMLTRPSGEALYRASQEAEEVGGECGSLYYHFHRKEWVRCRG